MKKRFLVPLTFLLLLTSCGDIKKEEVSLAEGFEILQKSLASTEISDRFGISFEAEKINIEEVYMSTLVPESSLQTYTNETITESTKYAISDMNLNLAMEGLTSATDFNGLKGSLTLGGNFEYQYAYDFDTSENQSYTFNDFYVGAYLTNSNLYADISNETLRTLLTKNNSELLAYEKIYVPINTENIDITFPLISEDLISQIVDNEDYKSFIEQIEQIDVSLFSDIVKIYSLGSGKYELSINADADKISTAFINYMLSQNESIDSTLMTSEMYELYLQQIKESIAETIDHINISLVFTEKGFSSLDVDMMIKSIVDNSNSDYPYISTTTYDLDFSLNLFNGNDVKMNFPTFFDDYVRYGDEE